MVADPKFLIAVATKDGISINLHFGHAKEFWVYEVSEEAVNFLERREVELYCHGNASSASAMEKILSTIKDCSLLLCAKIGEGPIEKLKRINVLACSDYAYEEITVSIEKYLKNG